MGAGLRLVNIVIFLARRLEVVWWSFSAEREEPSDYPSLFLDEPASMLVVVADAFFPLRVLRLLACFVEVAVVCADESRPPVFALEAVFDVLPDLTCLCC